MKATNKFILFCLLLSSFLSLNYICVSDDISTLAYYSDIESCAGNTIIAGVWNSSLSSAESKAINEIDFFNANESFNNSGFSANSEADLLELLNSVLVIPSDKEKQSYWKLDIKGTSNLTIDVIHVCWNSSQINNSNLTKITIKESEFFNGSKSSGELIDGTNYSFHSNSMVNLKSYFDSDVSYLIPLTINITMGDGSVKNYTSI
ncbi:MULTISPECIES: hypothetical protein [unclassified Methanosarcina]|uniref:hypothetical protein n=1 Tax=unclassified Methanosarcina TaxID=2644672 RepID=UPI000616129C|nr:MULTISPECIES: hypothetical protein [unclassified Methanosarcina]AKB18260.1 hypothetical protein MSWHS_1397 [Methanosarcina sp. WWM596]AKB21584.1 hypothetical protein MSWH1_1313 [Methanosarcina sp. WH1]